MVACRCRSGHFGKSKVAVLIFPNVTASVRGLLANLLTRRNKSLARNPKYVRKRLPTCVSSGGWINTILSGNMTDLSVEVRDQNIIVTKPGTGLCVTYRRVLNEPVLEALCSMRGDPDATALKFLTEAWKAAHAKAKTLGWFAP